MEEDNVLEEQSNEEVNNGESANQSSQETINLVELLGLDEIPVKIPIDYLFVYNKLLLLMVELGESMLLDCKSLCNTKNTPIIECYHMFKTAIAAKQFASGSSTGSGLSRGIDDRNYYARLADTLIDYVKVQLNAVSNNYKDALSFILPYDKYGLANLFITKGEANTELIINNTDNLTIEQLKEYFSIAKSVIQGFVVTETSYSLTQEQVDTHRYWHVTANNEFVPNTSTLHVNGVRYILDDDDYEEWIIENNGVQKGVGVILKTGYFDVGVNSDEIYIKAELMAK